MSWWDSAPKVDPFAEALSAEGVSGPIADLARSIYTQESSSGKNAKTSNRGAVGGMQILPSTFASVADKDWSINDPIQNIRGGLRYLKQLSQQAGGDPALTAAGYYGGPGGLEKARKGIAVSDPVNPNAPNTLEYGAQVAGRLKPAASPAASQENWWASAPVVDATTEPATDASGGAAFGVYPSARRQAKNNTPNALDSIAMGGARGVKDVIDTGAELLASGYDRATGNGPSVTGLVTGQQGEGARVRAMNQQGKQDFQEEYGGSTLAGASRVAGNIAATLPVGGVLAAPLRAAAPVGSVAARLGNSLASGGMTVGQGGGAATNMLLRMAGGAGTGAASAGLIDPNATTTGAMIGAALPPVIRTAGAIGGATTGLVRGVRDMTTSAGQGRIAESVLRASATNPELAARTLAQARPVLAGSNPTMAQVANDPGLAQLERTFLNNPELAAPLQARFAEQRAARAGAIDDVAGRGTYYDDIKEGRRIFAKEDYQKALNAKIDPARAKELQPQIDDLISRPSIKSAMEDAKRLAAETGESITDFGSLRGLDWVNKALDNKISIAKNPGSAIGKADLAALQQTKRDLMSTLEHLSPDYKEAITNYAKMSRQVNSMDVARKLDEAYTPVAANFGNTAKEQGNAFMKSLSKAQDSVKSSTGLNKELSDVMNTGDIFGLENVGRDLARKQYAESAGAATGSPTMQNMMSQQLIRRIMDGAGIPVEAAASSTTLNTLLRPVEFAGKLAIPKVNNRLVELALDPQKAAAALRSMPPEQAASTLARLPPNRLMALARSVGQQAPYRALPALSAE